MNGLGEDLLKYIMQFMSPASLLVFFHINKQHIKLMEKKLDRDNKSLVWKDICQQDSISLYVYYEEYITSKLYTQKLYAELGKNSSMKLLECFRNDITDKSDKTTFESSIYRSAAWSGNVQVLNWVLNNGPFLISENVLNRIIFNALYDGHNHLNVLKWLHNHKVEFRHNTILCYLETDIGSYGYLDILKWCVRIGLGANLRGNTIIKQASLRGHLNIIEYMVSNGFIPDSSIWIGAIKNGHSHILLWAHNKGYRFNVNACRIHPNVVIYLREIGYNV